MSAHGHVTNPTFWIHVLEGGTGNEVGCFSYTELQAQSGSQSGQTMGAFLTLSVRRTLSMSCIAVSADQAGRASL